MNNLYFDNVKEEDKKDEFVMALPWQDIFYAAKGGDEKNMPNAFGICTVVQDGEDEDTPADTLEEMPFENAYYQFHISGGAAVVEAMFYPDQEVQYHTCWNFLTRWFQMLSKKNIHDLLHRHLVFVLTPKIFHGEINVLFHSLVYINGHRTKNGFKLVMVFDNQETDIFLPNESDINWKEMEAEIEAQIAAEEAELDKVIKVLKEEKVGLEMSELYTETLDEIQNGPIEISSSEEHFVTHSEKQFETDADQDAFIEESNWNGKISKEGEDD